ncbi:MAG TPA: LacI family DNA-binding transcriptional regulator [Amycolatopsis sp.]|uniref:LacI family DNA-binding transcriptional regulator n=1 Tax=Amycolatopsis sp. TaxID=37632 RepID=UPI002B482B40|nr:LacI family DNA-binding transcriptional regulator [Amycolatopsis sp.]HKS47730.1 LacI family DNA-binding transcriptional regulator [Amycolatopsis sp.]
MKHSATVTLSEVAAAAGVSLATASRALNGSVRRVREDLKERVLDAAKRLDYSANAQAQAMARGFTNVVGLVVHDIADPYFSSIAAGVTHAAEGHDLLVTLGSTARNPERELDYLTMLRRQRSRAAILAGSRVGDKELTDALRREVVAFQEAGGHVVAISQARLPVDTVVVENRASARLLARELAKLGYRRFAVLAGAPELLTARDRVQGFKDGLAESPARLVASIDGAFTRDGGYAAMTELLATKSKVDCVFAVNDVMAVGAMAACRDHGIALPGDLAIAGFDDITTLRDVTPSLTTVRLPLDQIGATALDLVITAEPGAKPRIRRVKGSAVLRASTPAR